MSTNSPKKLSKDETAKRSESRLQYGALTYRETEAAGLEILLVTSRRTKRWIIPKGWPIKGLKAHEAAEREAYEEAGVYGKAASKQLGSYVYSKLLDAKAIVVPCEVRVFALRVRSQDQVWPEFHQREARWFTPDDAIASVDEEGLRALIAAFATSGLDSNERAPQKSEA